MPAPTIVSHSFAAAADDIYITIPAPAGIEEHHILIAYLAAVVEHQIPPAGQPNGWFPTFSEESFAVVSPDSGLGAYLAFGYTLNYVGVPAADYTFQMLSTAGFGGIPPANETPFQFAHGHLLALDRGLDGSATSDSAVAFTPEDHDFGPGPNLVAPPSLMLNFLASCVGPSAAFGTVVADEGFTMIGVYDTTGLTAGDNLGARTISGDLGYSAAFWAQLEEVFGTPVEPTGRAAWGVLAR